MGYSFGFLEAKIDSCASFFLQRWVVYHITLKCVFHLAHKEPSTSVIKEELGSADVIAVLVF